MEGIVNAAQAQAWNGYEGQHWAAHDERYDAVNDGFNGFLFDAAAIGEQDQVLDIGCGNGQLTRQAARRAWRGRDLGAVFGAMTPYLPRPTGPAGTGPTSFSDPARIRAVLTGAGFQDVAGTDVEADQVWGRDVADAAEFINGWGPVRYHMDQAGPDAATAARAALAAALHPFATPGAVRLRGTAWLVTAVTPMAP